MGRAPCCDKSNVKRGPWSPEEDEKLKEYIEKHGSTGGNWIALPQKAGLKRCGKSCRFRWLNYLRPNIKHGQFSEDEDRIICNLFATIGSRWSIIASQLPGRTDNDIKNYWNTKLKKKMMGIMNPSTLNQPHQVTLLSILQNSIPSSPLSFRESHNSYYYQPHVSFTGSESISYSSSLMSSGNSSITSTTPFNSIFQAQESLLGPNENPQVVTIPKFGGEASCNSSDGSCNNQISQVREAELGYGRGDGTCADQVGVVNLFYNGVEDTQKSLDYGLEEIKQ